MENVLAYLCRGCWMAGRKKDMYPLDDVDIRSLFESCTAISLDDDPTGPQHLCFHCFHQCQMWFSFMSLCQQRETENRIKLEEGLKSPEKCVEVEAEHSADSGTFEEDDQGQSSSELDESSDEIMYDDDETMNPSEMEDQAGDLSEFEDFLDIDSTGESTHWRCPLCHAHFADYIYLREHLKERHLLDGIAQCPICKLNMTRMSKVLSHIVSVHMKTAREAISTATAAAPPTSPPRVSDFDDGAETCVLCREKLSSEELFQHLQRQHFSKTDRKCPLCSRVCMTQNGLVCHVLYKHPAEDAKETRKPVAVDKSKFITCHVCMESFETFGVYDRHFSEKHFQNEPNSDPEMEVTPQPSEATSALEIEPQPEQTSQDTFMDGTDSSHTSQSQVDEQPRRKIKIRVKKCPICGKWVKNLYMHKRRHDTNVVDCPICHKKVRSIDYGRHKKVILSCKFCPEKFCLKRALNKHIKIMHSQTAFRVFEKFNYK